jgi:8-oxo-dGTP pyrophosphatase MutT (NUDIX family)
VFFQIRSTKKPTFPGMLDSMVGGHYRVNEASCAVVREVQEEIGIKVSFRELTPLGRRIDIATFGGMPKREIAEVFLLMRDLPLGAYRPDPVEVEGLVEIPIAKGLKFFSGEVGRIAAKGIKRSHKSGRWIDVAMAVKPEGFRSEGRFVLLHALHYGPEVPCGRKVPLNIAAQTGIAT